MDSTSLSSIKNKPSGTDKRPKNSVPNGLWIVQYCVEHRAVILVIGSNKGWKQKVNIGKENNQNFTGIPHDQLKQLVTYKAWKAGIQVIEQEESYTSRADVTAGDFIPVYGEENGVKYHFSGRRVKRGLYRCSLGYCINADCNGAANILRKAIPSAWEGTADFHFLAYPEPVGFQKLNPHPIPKRTLQKNANRRK